MFGKKPDRIIKRSLFTQSELENIKAQQAPPKHFSQPINWSNLQCYTLEELLRFYNEAVEMNHQDAQRTLKVRIFELYKVKV